MWGLLAVLITNDDATLSGQLTGLGAILGYTFIASLVVWFILKMVFGIRLSDEEQAMGADSPRLVSRLIQSSLNSTDKPQAGDTLLHSKSRREAAFLCPAKTFCFNEACDGLNLRTELVLRSFMKYKSTRGQVSDLGFSDALLMGLASDGGLLVPETFLTCA